MIIAASHIIFSIIFWDFSQSIICHIQFVPYVFSVCSFFESVFNDLIVGPPTNYIQGWPPLLKKFNPVSLSSGMEFIYPGDPFTCGFLSQPRHLSPSLGGPDPLLSSRISCKLDMYWDIVKTVSYLSVNTIAPDEQFSFWRKIQDLNLLMHVSSRKYCLICVSKFFLFLYL